MHPARTPHFPRVRARRARVHATHFGAAGYAHTVNGQSAKTAHGQTRAQTQAPVWLFDLDNTLHDASHKIFPEISLGMTAAVMESLNVDEPTANILRTKYWKRYGATMIGMVRHHDIRAHEFLHRSQPCVRDRDTRVFSALAAAEVV